MISYHESRQTLEEAELDHIWGVGGEEEEPPKFIGTRSFIPRVWTQFSSNNSCIKKRAWIFSKSYPPVWIHVVFEPKEEKEEKEEAARLYMVSFLLLLLLLLLLCTLHQLLSFALPPLPSSKHAHVHMHTFISS